MAEEKKDQHPAADDSFRVIDRRLFTAEGERRREVAEEEKSGETDDKKAPAAAPAPPQAQGAAAPAPAEAPRPSRSFQKLIAFLAQNADLYLGGMADPATGQAMVHLEGAREILDMLDALREKTRGQLAPEEERLLLDVIGSLKMAFLEVSQAAAKAAREKAPHKP